MMQRSLVLAFMLLLSSAILHSAEIANDKKDLLIDEQLRLADGLAKRGHYALAIDEYRKILEKFPDNPLAADALSQMADAYAASGNLGKALENYRRFLLKYPRVKTAWAVKANYAMVLLKTGRKEDAKEAVSILSEVKNAKDCPTEVRDFAAYSLAKYHSDSGESLLAKAEFRELSSRKIASKDDIYAAYARIELAAILDSEGKGDQASALLKSLTDDRNTPPEILCPALNYLASVHFKEKEYLKASEAYESLCLMFPESPEGKEAYFRKFECLLSAKEYPRLIREIDRELAKSRITIDSNTEVLAYLKASALMEQGLLKEAGQAFTEIINSPSASAGYASKASLQLIQCLISQNKTQDAEREAKSLMKRGKILPAAKPAAAATVCSAMKKPFEKIAFMKDVVETARDVKERDMLRVALADLYFNEAQPDNALSLYREILTVCGDELKPQCHFGIGKIFEAAGKEADAVESFRKITVEYPKSPLYPEALLKCAVLRLYEKPDSAESREILTGLARDYAGNSEILGNALFYLAYMDFAKGKFHDAYETFRKIADDGRYGAGLRFTAKQYLLWSFVSANMNAEADRLFQELSSSPESFQSVNPELIFLLARKYDEKGKTDNSMMCYRALAENGNPDYRLRGQTGIGRILEKKGDPDKALAAYREGEKIRTSDAELYSELLSHLGTLLLKKGRKNEAVAVFEKSIELAADKQPSYRSRLGLARILSESEEELARANRYAMSVFILSKDPSLSQEAIVLSIEISLKQNKRTEAKATFEELKKRFPQLLKEEKIKNLQTLLK